MNGNQTLLTNEKRGWGKYYSLSPDGKKVAWGATKLLQYIDLSSSNPEFLIIEVQLSGDGGEVGVPVWLPNSKEIIWTNNSKGIFKTNIETHQTTKILDYCESISKQVQSISSDGKKCSFRAQILIL